MMEYIYLVVLLIVIVALILALVRNWLQREMLEDKSTRIIVQHRADREALMALVKKTATQHLALQRQSLDVRRDRNELRSEMGLLRRHVADNLNLLIGHGYKNKTGPLEHSPALKRLQELSRKPAKEKGNP